MADTKTLSVRLEAQIQGYLSQLRTAGAATETFGKRVDGSVGRADRKLRTLDKTASSGTGALSGLAKAGERAGGELDRSVGRADSRLKTLRQSAAASIGPLSGLGKAGALLGVTFGAAKAVDVLRNSVAAASDLNETVSKAGVIFGPAGAEVVRFGERSAKALGISKNEAIGAAATFGNLFVGMKIGQQPAADMSTRLVTLAGDLASFNNVDPGVALEALRSGLVGETEPLRRFGVNLNQASIEQEALRLGLISTTKDALTPAAKAQATYSLVLQQTKTAQGDFARTSGGLANQQRILSAEWKNAQAALGKQLLPAMVGLAHFATGTLIPAINGVLQVVESAVSLMGRFPGPVKETTLVLGGLVLGLYALSRAGAAIKTLVAPSLDLLLGKKVAQIATNEALIASEGQLAAAELAAARAGAAGGLGGAAAAAGGAAGAARTGGLLGAGGLAGKVGSAARIIPQAAIVAGVADVVTKVPDIKLPGPSWLTGTISLNKILGGTGPGSAKSVTKSLKDQEDPLTAAAAAERKHAAAMYDAALAARREGMSLGTLSQKIAEATSNTASAWRTEDSYRDAVASASATIKENGRSHDANTAKGRANREALLGLVDASHAHMAALVASNAPARVLTATIASQRRQFIDQAIATGYSRDQAVKLADRLNLIPKDVKSRVAVLGAAEAARAADGVGVALSQLHDKTIHVSVETSHRDSIGAAMLNVPGKAIGGRIAAGELSTISERGFEGFKPDYGSGAGTVQVIRPTVSGVVIPHAQMVAAGYGPTGSAPTRPQVVEVNRGPLIGELHVHTTSGASAADIAHETFFAAHLAARSGGR